MHFVVSPNKTRPPTLVHMTRKNRKFNKINSATADEKVVNYVFEYIRCYRLLLHQFQRATPDSLGIKIIIIRLGF